jgi:amidase
LTNCLTEIFFEQAVERALALDDYLDKNGEPMGPLHGLPISLKDTFKIPGHDASIGFISLAFKPATTSSTLVDILLKAGAVLYCKTNVPQTLMALDSHNNVFGRVINPLNTKVTAGGSSGGEGALVAMRGSILGIGTDVGGSIRVPAFCNNLYGIKPSWQRVPYGNQQGSGAPGSSAIALPASAGPIATSMRDCELFLRSVAESDPWSIDPDVAYGSWDEQGFSPPKPQLRVGIVRRDGVIDPLPPINKIMDETASMLRKQGITVVEMDITPLFSQCQSLANAIFGIDGNNFAFDTLESTGEPLSPWLSTRLRRKKAKSVEEVVALHAKKEELRRNFLNIWRDEHGLEIDVFICPIAPHPVPEIDRWNGVSYTSSFVLLDYPAGVSLFASLQTKNVATNLLRLCPFVLLILWIFRAPFHRHLLSDRGIKQIESCGQTWIRMCI